jgi:hypothetical protein
MAFTSEELDDLKAAYAAGVTSVRHASGHSVTYASLEDLWAAIQRIERSLIPRSRRVTHGVIRFRRDA